jgi:hypothetical protein
MLSRTIEEIPMSVEENKAIVHRTFEELDKHNFAVLPRHVSLLLAVLSVVLIIEFIVVSVVSAAPGGVVDAAALLTVITGVAVAIERFLEGLWATVALLGASDWWPLNALSQEVQTLATTLNKQLTPFFDAAKAEIGKLQQAGTVASADAAEAKKTIDDLAAQLEKLGNANLGSARLRAIIAAADQTVAALQQQYPTIQASAALATAALADFSSAVDYLKDNPGRKVISLFLGMMLGMLAAGLFSLDLVPATLGPSAANYAIAGFKLKYVTVGLTGVVIGLGSNPLHEIISTLQQIKISRKIANA